MRGGLFLAAASSIVLVSGGCPAGGATQLPERVAQSWIELFPGEGWNYVAPGDGDLFEGVVRYMPADGLPSFVMRYNPYRLEGRDGSLTDIYCGSSDALSPFIDTPVEIEGRIETMEVEGVPFVEIWPARIRPASPAGPV